MKYEIWNEIFRLKHWFLIIILIFLSYISHVFLYFQEKLPKIAKKLLQNFTTSQFQKTNENFLVNCFVKTHFGKIIPKFAQIFAFLLIIVIEKQ